MTKKPWGHERIIAKTDSYVVKEIYVKPNSRLSLQYHERKTETMFLVEGEATLSLSHVDHVDGWVMCHYYMTKMRPYFIKPGDHHRLSTAENVDCLVVEVSSIELDDVVRLDDDYGRQD